MISTIRCAKIAACLTSLCLASIASAQFSSSSGSTVTNDNVGIGVTTPTAKLQIQSGYQISGGGSNPCTASGLPALDILWLPPGAASNCPNSPTPPNALNIYTASGYYGVGGWVSTVTPYLTVDGKGLTGIGMIPKSGKQLSVSGYSYLAGNTQVTTALRINSSTNLNPPDWSSSVFPYSFSVDNGNSNFENNVRIAGKLRIGSTEPIAAYGNYQLGVDGDIVCKRLIVETADWADYVFDKSYRLRSLSALSAYISQNHHLPDVPSEEDVRQKGISVGDMQAVLLKKVEELTLYTLQLEQRVKELESHNQ